MNHEQNAEISTCPQQSFLTALGELSGAFAAAREDVRQRETALKRALDELSQVVTPPSQPRHSQLREDNPLIQAANEADKKLVARLEHWRQQVETYDRNTEFRKDYGDSLLVYVYGKVKAGKSSLGNYIAYGRGDPDQAVVDAARAAGQAPTFFLKDDASAEDRESARDILLTQGKFAVGASETTTSIQGFRLPGLTWVDSPGLHSVTPENGKLAKAYAEAADLILFPMNSGQPGRASDLAEIAGLLRQRKPFVVIITRCDLYEEDVDDDGHLVRILTMKSEDDRQAQTDYVQQEILNRTDQKTHSLLDAEILTISVAYAEAHAADPDKLRASGLSPLFDKLTKLTQSQGIAIKRQTPLNNLRAFVDKVLTGDPELSVDVVQADLAGLETQLGQQRTQLKQKRTAVTGRVLMELNPAIEQEVLRQRERRDMHELQRVCNTLIQTIVERHAIQALSEILTDTQKWLNTAVRFNELKGLPEFRDLTEEFQVSNAGKGRAIGGGIGGVWLAGLGLALGGPIGLAIGAAVGNWLGAEAGEHLAGSKTMRVHLGDNAHEVRDETIQIANKAAERAVDASFAQFETDFLIPIERRLRDIHAALDRFERVLTQEVRPQ